MLNWAETVQAIANYQSLSEKQAQVHSTARTCQAVHKNCRNCFTRQKARLLVFSEALPGPALACTLQRSKPKHTCQTTRGDSNTTNPASQNENNSANNPLVGARPVPFRYDQRMACPHAQTHEIFRYASFQVPSTGDHMNLPQRLNLNASGHETTSCSR